MSLEKYKVALEEHKALRASAAGGYNQLKNPYIRPVAIMREGRLLGYSMGLFGDGVRGPQWLSSDLLTYEELDTLFSQRVDEIVRFVREKEVLPRHIHQPLLLEDDSDAARRDHRLLSRRL